MLFILKEVSTIGIKSFFSSLFSSEMKGEPITSNIKAELFYKEYAIQSCISIMAKALVLSEFETFEKGKAITIPLTVFNPAIAPQQTAKLIAEASVVNEHVIKGIQNPKTVTVQITKATILLSNGEKVVLEKVGEVKP